MVTQIEIKRSKERIVDMGHPWIFSGALHLDKDKPKAGEIVEVRTSTGKLKAVGHYGTGSIAVRILSRKEIALDQDFWNEKVLNAVNYRLDLKIHNDNNDCFRLIHGEGDFLPGLIVDYYAGMVVVQCHTLGMYYALDMIKAAILSQKALPVDSIYVKSERSLKNAPIPIEDGLIHGENSLVKVNENGSFFEIDAVNGQKTGFFLDQRNNRFKLGRIVEGKKVLNTFCFTGGFSVNALKGGAKEVISIDVSQKAMDQLEKNILLNDIDPKKHTSICGDVMAFLRDTEETYDVIILDPPAFAKSRNKRHNAVQAYKRLNLAGMKRLNPGGILMTYSCSQVVDQQLFYNTIVSAGLESKREFRVVELLSQGPDHPVNLFHSEGKYLKGILFKEA